MPKFILERWNGVLYAYTECNKHYKKMEKKRRTPRLNASVLAQNCVVADIEGDFHIVVKVKK